MASSSSPKQAQKAKKVAQSPTPMVTEEISFAQTVKEGQEKTPMFLFRVPKHYTALTGHDRTILDLLWKDHHSAGFLTAMNTLAGHLQALRYMKTLPSPATATPIKLEPHTLEAYIGKELKISALEKELSQAKEQLSLLEAEKAKLQQRLDLCTATWQTELENQWAQTRTKIPPQLFPAQQHIYELVKTNQHQQFVELVRLLQQIALNKTTRPRGLHLTMISLFRDSQHPDEPHCLCHKGFTIIKAAIDLAEWQDCTVMGISVSLQDLFQYGLLDRLVVHALHLDKIVSFPWRLKYCINHMYKYHRFHGYLDLNISTCPPWFLGYPSDAKHQVLIKLQQDWLPDFWDYHSFQQELLRVQDQPLEQQILLWRHYTMTKEYQILYPSFLMAEDKTLKVYVDDEHEVTYVPFPSHFITHPGQHEHLQHVKNETALITERKDYGRQDHHMDDADDYILEAIQDD